MNGYGISWQVMKALAYHDRSWEIIKGYEYCRQLEGLTSHKILWKFRCFWKCCKLSHTTNNHDMSPLGLMLLLLLWREISQHNLKHLTENLIAEENLIKWSFKTPVQDLIGQLGLYFLRDNVTFSYHHHQVHQVHQVLAVLAEKCNDYGRPWESMGGGVNDV